jgi:hypothetical protein
MAAGQGNQGNSQHKHQHLFLHSLYPPNQRPVAGPKVVPGIVGAVLPGVLHES